MTITQYYEIVRTSVHPTRVSRALSTLNQLSCGTAVVYDSFNGNPSDHANLMVPMVGGDWDSTVMQCVSECDAVLGLEPGIESVLGSSVSQSVTQ